MAELYASTRYMLRAGLERPPHAEERVLDAQMQARDLLLAQGIDAGTIAAIWADFPEEIFLRIHPSLIAWQTMGIARAGKGDKPLVLIDAQGPRGGSEVFVHARDGDGLFAAVTAVFERMRLSVFDARIVTSKSGWGMDSFLVLDQAGHVLDADTAQRLQAALDEVLRQTPYPVQVSEQRPARRLKHFNVPTRIEFRRDPSTAHTQLALVCSDRPGLLATVAQTLRERRVRVHDARIATFGERVEDFFLLSDEYNRALNANACAALRDLLVARVAAQATTSTNKLEPHKVEQHVIS